MMTSDERYGYAKGIFDTVLHSMDNQEGYEITKTINPKIKIIPCTADINLFFMEIEYLKHEGVEIPTKIGEPKETKDIYETATDHFRIDNLNDGIYRIKIFLEELLNNHVDHTTK